MNKALRYSLALALVVFSWLLYCQADLLQVKYISEEEKIKVVKPDLKHSDLKSRMEWLEKEVSERASPLLKKIQSSNNKATLIVFKKDRVMELWTQGEKPEKLKTYSLYAYSGKLGPKNREGDYQIPEGTYKATHLNPNSSYYLSIGINYPNPNDIQRAQKNKIEQMGGDIFIHGRRNSVGCVSIGDHFIEEVFFIAGKIGPSNVKVLIAPTRLPLPELKSIDLAEGDDLIKQKYDTLKKELALYSETKDR